MKDVKCPSCGSPNVEQIDTDKYQCPYCGQIFTSYQAASAAEALAKKQAEAKSAQVEEVDEEVGFFKGAHLLVKIMYVIVLLFSFFAILGGLTSPDKEVLIVGVVSLIPLGFMRKMKSSTKKCMIIVVVVLAVLVFAVGDGSVLTAFSILSLLLLGLLSASMNLTHKGKSAWKRLSQE